MPAACPLYGFVYLLQDNLIFVDMFDQVIDVIELPLIEAAFHNNHRVRHAQKI